MFLCGWASSVLAEIYSQLYRIFPNKWYQSVGSIGSNGWRRKKDREGLKKGGWYPPLEIVEPLQRRCIKEHRAVSFKKIWASNEGEPRNWIRDIQGEINYLKMKGINFNEIFSVLVKIMKKVESSVDLARMNSNGRVRLKISSIVGWKGRLLLRCTMFQPTLCLSSLNELVGQVLRS